MSFHASNAIQKIEEQQQQHIETETTNSRSAFLLELMKQLVRHLNSMGLKAIFPKYTYIFNETQTHFQCNITLVLVRFTYSIVLYLQ